MSQEKICFIISPIGEEGKDIRKNADEKYDLIYEPILRDLGYTPVRADKENTPNSISRGIVKRIIESEMVITDVTGYNANVFYELAIRNAVKKPVIIIKEKDQKLPFDIYDKRAISIDMSNNRQWTNAKKELKNHIDNAEKCPQDASESILTEFTFQISGEQKHDEQSDIKLLLKDMKDEMRRITESQSKDKEVKKIQSDPILSLSTNKTIYKDEDRVMMFLEYRDIPNEQQVNITIKNPRGEIDTRFTLQISGNGKISRAIQIVDKTTLKGTWAIDAICPSYFATDYFIIS